MCILVFVHDAMLIYLRPLKKKRTDERPFFRTDVWGCTSVLPIRRITSTIFFVDPIWIVRILSKILNFFFENMGIASKSSIQNFGNFAAGDERLKYPLFVQKFLNLIF